MVHSLFFLLFLISYVFCTLDSDSNFDINDDLSIGIEYSKKRSNLINEEQDQNMGRTCFYCIGPKAGTFQDYPNIAPLPVGSSCFDGGPSKGYVVPRSGIVGSFQLSGDQMACTERTSINVGIQANNNIPKTGLATFINNSPYILLKTSQLATQTYLVRQYLYAHECGHHTLGQVCFLKDALRLVVRCALMYNVFMGPPFESAADCYAFNTLKAKGIWNATEIQKALQFISTLPGDQWNYDGPGRVAAVRKCLQ